MNNAKKFHIEYRITNDGEIKKSTLLTHQQAIELQLYCESKNYCQVLIIKNNFHDQDQKERQG